MGHLRVAHRPLEAHARQESTNEHRTLNLLHDQHVGCARVSHPFVQLTHPQCADEAPIEHRNATHGVIAGGPRGSISQDVIKLGSDPLK